MKQRFNVPHRQSIWYIVIVTFGQLRTLASQGLGLFLMLFFLLRRVVHNPFYLIAVMILGLILILGLFLFLGYYQFKNYVFYIDYKENEFHLNSGVLQKNTLSFPIPQIQQIYVERKWMQRIFGLSAVTIEVAGASSETIKLNALTNEMAQSLMSELRTLQKQKEMLTPPPFIIDPIEISPLENHEDLLQLPLKKASFQPKVMRFKLKNILINAMITQIFYGIFLMFIPFQFLGYQQILKVMDFIEDNFIIKMVWGPLVIILFILLTFLLSIVLNVIRSLLMHFNMEMKEVDKNQFQLSQGLINLKTIQIKSERVQMVEVQQNYLQRKFKLYTLVVKQLEDLEETQSERGIRIPGVTLEQLHQLVDWGFIPNFIPEGQVVQPLMRKFWIKSLLFSVIMGLGALQLIFFVNLDVRMVVSSYVFLMIIYVLWNYRAVKVEKMFYTKQHVWHSFGVWQKVTNYFPLAKVQSIKDHHYFWQKKFIHAQILTAGGRMDLRFYPFQVWKKIQNNILRYVEKNQPRWY